MSMSIFSNPTEEETYTGLTVLFLHGLEGSPEGEKSVHFKKKWGGKTPALRTSPLRSLKSECGEIVWKDAPKDKLEDAVNTVYQDALAALNYCNPDVVIGSSMGGAILAKLVSEGRWDGPSVFLAPAIDMFLGPDIVLPKMIGSVWVLGEFDEIVRNDLNIERCVKSGGNLLISPEDGHRLYKALSSGLIDCAITTVLELGHMNI